jgi:hypothetical protein
MHETASVGLGKPFASIHEERDRLLDRERSTARDPRRQVFALEELHDDEGVALLRAAEVEDAHHVLVRQQSTRTSLSFEAHDRIFAVEGPRPEQLDGDALPERKVRAHADDRHPPFADDAIDAVLPADDRTRPNRHRRHRTANGVALEVSYASTWRTLRSSQGSRPRTSEKFATTGMRFAFVPQCTFPRLCWYAASSIHSTVIPSDFKRSAVTVRSGARMSVLPAA